MERTAVVVKLEDVENNDLFQEYEVTECCETKTNQQTAMEDKILENMQNKTGSSVVQTKDEVSDRTTEQTQNYLIEKISDDEIHSTNDDSVTNENVRKRKRSCRKGERKFLCGVCDVQFDMDELKSHMKIHHGKTPFLCKFCHKCFIKKSNLSMHMKTHPDKHEYFCKICHKSCFQKGNLKIHMRIHTGEKPYPCDFCSKSFTTSSHLNIHRRLHTGERPYWCVFCCKTFAKKYNFDLHVRTHTGAKPFPCTQCNKSFVQKCQLKRHQNVHSKAS